MVDFFEKYLLVKLKLEEAIELQRFLKVLQNLVSEISFS